MCLNNRQGRTNSKNIGYYRPYRVGYKCGYCSECIREKRNEYLLRSYFESLDTFEKNGYILFDTLTYDDSHLPRISRYYPNIANEFAMIDGKMMNLDFSCFDYKDIRKFTNLLWTTINRHPLYRDYNVKENLKFFCVSEYGHEEDYVDDYGHVRKGTFRPHYHILFYVKDRSLQPGILAHLIYKCWKCGNTDNNRNFWDLRTKNCIGLGFTKDKKKNILAISNYVSKYITKDAEYVAKVDARLDALCHNMLTNSRHWIYSPASGINGYRGVLDIKEDIEYVNKYYTLRDDLRHLCMPFHRQSRGFGATALDKPDVVNSILNKFEVVIPDVRYVKKVYAVPLYYMRKLFYKTVKDEDNNYHWVLNDLGKEKYPSIMENKCNRLFDRYWQWFQNLDGYGREDVLNLLDGRDFHDVAEYVTYYRGRVLKSDGLVPTIDEIVQSDINYNPLDKTDIINDGYTIFRRCNLLDGSDIDFDNMLDEYFTSLYGEDYDYLEDGYKLFERHFVINEETDFRFRDFDKLLVYYEYTKLDGDFRKESRFGIVENLSKKLKK